MKPIAQIHDQHIDAKHAAEKFAREYCGGRRIVFDTTTRNFSLVDGVKTYHVAMERETSRNHYYFQISEVNG